MNTKSKIIERLVMAGIFILAVAFVFEIIKDKSKSQVLSEQIKIEESNTEVIKTDYKQLRAKHVNSNVVTTVAVYEADNFKPGDTILSRFWATENCLQVIYHLPVDRAQGVIKLVIIE